MSEDGVDQLYEKVEAVYRVESLAEPARSSAAGTLSSFQRGLRRFVGRGAAPA